MNATRESTLILASDPLCEAVPAPAPDHTPDNPGSDKKWPSGHLGLLHALWRSILVLAQSGPFSYLDQSLSRNSRHNILGMSSTFALVSLPVTSNHSCKFLAVLHLLFIWYCENPDISDCVFMISCILGFVKLFL